MFRSQTQTTLSLSELIRVFESTFPGTRLIGGNPEPEYRPASADRPAEIRFTRDYLRSALHEIAHWCVAGGERLKLPDYGYWYRPDGRNAEEQEEFFRVEVRPQAVEKVFSDALGVEFQVSCDNLGGTTLNAAPFESAVVSEAEALRSGALPPRARQFLGALAARSQIER